MKSASTIWITGALGFSGQHLIRHLRQQFDQLTLVGIGRRVVGVEQQHGLDHYFAIDLTDNGALKQALQAHKPDVVFHLASVMPPMDTASMWSTNVQGTYQLLTGLAENDARDCQFLCVSSAAEYHQQKNGPHQEDDIAVGFTPYGKSKAAQTMLALSLGRTLDIDVRIARPFNLIGPGLAKTFVAGRICDQLNQQLPSMKLGNLTPQRDFVDARDAVIAYCDILQYGNAYEIYNVCSETPTAIQTIVDLALENVTQKPEIEYDKDIGGRSELDAVYGSRKKLTALSGWQPTTPLANSIIDMLAHND